MSCCVGLARAARCPPTHTYADTCTHIPAHHHTCESFHLQIQGFSWTFRLNITPGNWTDSQKVGSTTFYQACHVTAPFQSPFDLIRGKISLREF